ncbi:hypothetical protein I41_37980 [Lacipirellula limnantheis]|uniref:Uncharacterized protein n=1 Tax=Lacipirellula limnantheis TaxID=2528024 RepID=A0A517U1V0_9BACT|nr:hypothetical protein I41_37980 [Lacipirellula limnantheis]
MSWRNWSVFGCATRIVCASALWTISNATALATTSVAPARVVALSGQRPGGLTPLTGFTRFDARPVIDGAGRVAFLAAAGDAFELTGAWAESASGVRAIAQAGDAAAPGGVRFAEFADLVMSDAGAIGFKALLAGATVNVETAESIWIERAGQMSLVARGGAEAPDPTKARRFLRFESPPALNGDGQLAFFARTRDKELEVVQDSGFYWFDGVQVGAIAAAGSSAIPGSEDVVFSAQSFEAPFADDPVVNSTGTTIFRGFIEGPGVGDSNLNGLWRYRQSDGLQLLLRGGDAALGVPGATFISFPAIPTINDAGESAFLAFYRLTDDPAQAAAGALVSNDAAIRLGLWLRRSSGELEAVFKLGDDAPGIAGDARFIDVFDPVLNGAGRVAIVAAVAGDAVTPSSEVGLWSSGLSEDGGIELVARQGDAAPGGRGTVFGVFLEPSLNAHGQTAFVATGYDPAIEPGLSQSVGIWGEDRTGTLRLVVESGQLLEVAPGDFRQVAGVAFASETGGQDGKSRGFNDAGQLAFHATFIDGSSGIFVSNLLAVPEPQLWPLLISAAICWRRPRVAAENARSFA